MASAEGLREDGKGRGMERREEREAEGFFGEETELGVGREERCETKG